METQMESTVTIWEAAQSGDDPQARESLMLQHVPLVHHVARQLMRSSSLDAEFDELVSAGTIGLINAIDNFDPGRGLAFSTFAAPRIRGSVLDDLRRRDHAPRSIRRKQRDIARASERLSRELGRIPTDEELSTELEIDIDKLWRWKHSVERASRVSIDAQVETSSGVRVAPKDTLVGEEGGLIESRLGTEEEISILRDEILNLKEQERIVLSLYYFEDLKLHEIATILGVTESRISQIRSKAVKSLRERLAPLRAG
jgi:RNA polymerase sigma factor FliA